jgi:hypothetical protein
LIIIPVIVDVVLRLPILQTIPEKPRSQNGEKSKPIILRKFRIFRSKDKERALLDARTSFEAQNI